MKKGFFISFFLTISIACSFSSCLPSTQTPSNNSSIPTLKSTQNSKTPTQSITLSSNTPSSPVEQLKWTLKLLGVPTFSFSDGTYYHNSFWESTYFHILTNDFSETTNQTRILIQRPYYYDNTSVYFMDENNQVSAIGLISGERIWQSDLQGTILGLDPNTVIVYRDDNRIYGLDKSSGVEKWKIIIGMLLSEGQISSPFPYSQYYQNEIIIPMKSQCKYAGQWAHGIVSIRFLHIDGTNGNHWMTDCNPDISDEGLLAFSNGIFIAEEGEGAGTRTENIVGYNPQNGSIKWKVDGDEDLYDLFTLIKLDTQDNLLYIETRNKSSDIPEFMIVDLITGNLVLDVKGQGNFFLTEKYIYLFASDKILVYLTENGSLINTIPQERSYSQLISQNGLIIYYPELGIGQGINPLTSEKLWENDEFYKIIDYTSYADIIIIEDDQHEIFALDQKTGSVLWKKHLDGCPIDKKFFSGCGINFESYGGLLLYRGLEDNSLWSLDPSSGDNQVIYRNPNIDRVYYVEPVDKKLWLVQFYFNLSLLEYK